MEDDCTAQLHRVRNRTGPHPETHHDNRTLHVNDLVPPRQHSTSTNLAREMFVSSVSAGQPGGGGGGGGGVNDIVPPLVILPGAGWETVTSRGPRFPESSKPKDYARQRLFSLYNHARLLWLSVSTGRFRMVLMTPRRGQYRYVAKQEPLVRAGRYGIPSRGPERFLGNDGGPPRHMDNAQERIALGEPSPFAEGARHRFPRAS